MILLMRQISIPEMRRHLLRNFLTLLGIVLGVAVFCAIRSANSSLKGALRDTINQIAGKAVLQVTAGQAGIPEPALDAVRSAAGVQAAVPIIEAVVRTTDAAQGNILILGIDMTGDRSMRDYRLQGDDEVVADPLVFLAQPDSLIVSGDFASRNNLTEGDSIHLITALGTRSFTVRGIMAPRGMARAFGGNLGVMDIYSAQFVFGRGRSFDRIDVALQEGFGIDEAIPRIQEKLGPGYRIETPLRRGKQTESLMEAFSHGLFLSSVMALLVGIFLIFNAFSVSVTQRRSQIGILRALGVTRAQIQALFLGESLLLGVVGSLLGIGAGILIGRGMMLFMATVVEQTYGVRVFVDRLHIDPFWTALSFAAGTAASMVGAYLPAQAAARVDPALALQKGKFQILFLGENRRRRLAGVLILLFGLGIGFTPAARTLQAQLIVFGALFASLVLLVPTFSHWIAGWLRHPMGWLFGMEGRLATDSLVQAPRRTSATVGALMFSLSFVLIMATFSASVKTSMMKWVEFAINSDLFVAASESLTSRNFQFPAEMADELKKVPGVRQVDSLRLIIIDYQTGAPLLVSIEIDQYLRRGQPLMEEGRVDDLLSGMRGKNGVLISNNLARLHALKKGSRMVLDTPTGRHDFEVVGVQVDYSSDSGSLLIDREVYKRLWNDDRVDTFDLMLEKGYSPDAVKREIQRRFADKRNVFVLTNLDMRQELLRVANQFFALQYVQIVVAVVVAVLGIINSLMVSITERKREIGILRSLGGERSQVRKAITLEAVCMGLVGVLLGIVGGTVMGYYSVGPFGAAFNGWVFPYRFPLEMALGLIPAVVLVSWLAALYPSSLALKTSLVEALAYE
jgi:putative ABC transport system permease protein